MWYMDGKRTSVYLTPDLAARVKESGRPLAALIAAGLNHPPVTAERVRKAHEDIRELTAEVRKITAAGGVTGVVKTGPSPGARKRSKPAADDAPCKHAHVIKGFCRECRTGGHY